ncbi:hypothetical protein [Singulisphaera acidiphila]|uniref:Uncharacterized protein n=1 Tax=Singulisphaera acidiphila (strain ATCC BAA-1392 / DSM 18658 / VKM B-2454 / MOB10) TaxID=886293 RepID=L0DEV2_SINAD|nr:hypothetical protein [Singulisphaera acidiphila]AGA27353.1 hypothetical protein Sinac_3072 [Singulisphaera acidiphila DSM 18658]
MRLKLRTSLILVACAGLLCWAATRVVTWYERRPTYRAQAAHHRIEAESLRHRLSIETNYYKLASSYVGDLLAHPEINVVRETPGIIRSKEFHPFSGPRSGWAAAVEAQGKLADSISKKVAYHARLSQEYARAAESFWSPVPSEGAVHPIP